jgi:hypothetical protein
MHPLISTATGVCLTPLGTRVQGAADTLGAKLGVAVQPGFGTVGGVLTAPAYSEILADAQRLNQAVGIRRLNQARADVRGNCAVAAGA